MVDFKLESKFPSDFPKAYENVSTFAAAYNVGKVESKAAINLLRHVPSSVRSALTALVRSLVNNTLCWIFLGPHTNKWNIFGPWSAIYHAEVHNAWALGPGTLEHRTSDSFRNTAAVDQGVDKHRTAVELDDFTHGVGLHSFETTNAKAVGWQQCCF